MICKRVKSIRVGWSTVVKIEVDLNCGEWWITISEKQPSISYGRQIDMELSSIHIVPISTEDFFLRINEFLKKNNVSTEQVHTEINKLLSECQQEKRSVFSPAQA